MSHPLSGTQKSEQDPPTGASRRNFLIATGAGAAAAGIAASMPVPVSGTPGTQPLTAPRGAQPLVAHIDDPSSGTLSLLVGEREIVVHDADLVARIVLAADKGA